MRLSRKILGVAAVTLLLPCLVAGAAELSQIPVADCEPIDPGVEVLPEKPCFSATHLGDGVVRLAWSVINTQDNVYLYDISGPPYRDPGVQPADCAPLGGRGCRVDVSLSAGGSHEWAIRATSLDGEQIHARAAIDITPPRAPEIMSDGGDVDFLAPESRVIRWHAAADNGWDEFDLSQAWVEVGLPGSFAYLPERFPRSGAGARYTIEATMFERVGSYDLRVRDCVRSSANTQKYCSPPAFPAIRVYVDRFQEVSSVYVQAGDDVTAAITTDSGDVRMLASETLLDPVDGWPVLLTAEDSVSFPGEKVTPGVHKVEVVSCLFPMLECANRVELEVSPATGLLTTRQRDYYYKGEVVAELQPAAGGAPIEIHATATGFVYFETSAGSQMVRKGDELGFVIRDANDVLYVLVNNPVNWELGRDYLLDFHPGTALSQAGNGAPLDIVFDGAGGLWQTKEFANSIEYVSGRGEVQSLQMPLARYASNTRGRLAVTTPFSFWITVDEAKSTNVSALSEKVLVSDDKIWFTQGGGLQPARTTAEANHSRVFSIDLLAEDSPKTLFDDRICAYNVPADEPGGPVNSQVLGMAVVGERVWLAESRGILSDEYAVVSSFIADERHCGNLLNFNDDRALAEQSLQYCSEFQTAEQDGCVERLILSELPKDTKVAHLEPDPDDGTIWFSDARGRFLGHIDPAKGNAVRVFEFEDTHSDPFNGVPEFGGFPWALRVDSSAVYIGEYATRHILRFDKASKSFSEVHIPCGSSQVTLHSIDLDPVRERLWFTLSNEQRNPLDKNASTIGYVDIGSWERHIATPDRHGEIDGVIYEGLSSIPASEALPDRHQAFRGIDVNDVTGDIAIATMWRNQITLLEPLPGFWP